MILQVGNHQIFFRTKCRQNTFARQPAAAVLQKRFFMFTREAEKCMQYHQSSHEKYALTFHSTDCLIGILKIVYYNIHLTV